ncbi:hypothetical protein [Longirhabdus pacifica]|nr:hypothetical protein [Longirhabdus pacifica]
MPRHKSSKIKDQQNDASLQEEAMTPKEKSLKHTAPSLNNINKNQT